MRISEIEVECEDIQWFAIDKFGKIISFTSGVYGNIPEFVCRSREETALLEEYFSNLSKMTFVKQCKGMGFGEDIIRFCKAMSEKGIYCFDAYDGKNHITGYTKISSPYRELKIGDVPREIYEILADHAIDVDVTVTDAIYMDNAY